MIPRLATACALLPMLLVASPAGAWNLWSWWGWQPPGRAERQQLQGIRAISAKLDRMSERLAALEEETAAVRSQTTSCTPAAIESGACAPEELAALTAQVCVNLGAEGALEAMYAVSGKTAVELGVGWDAGVEADLVAGLEGPLLLPAGPVSVPVPDLELKGGAKGGVGVNVCFREIEIPGAGDGASDLGTRLVDAVQASAPRIRAAVEDAVESRRLLEGERLAGMLGKLDRVGAADLRTEDPLAFFREGGELRELVDDLPVGERVKAVLDDPESVYPLDTAAIAPECERFAGNPVLDPMAREICSVLGELPSIDQMRQIPERARRIESRVQTIEQNLSDLQSALGVGGLPPTPLPPAPPPPPPIPCPGALGGLCDKF